MKKEFLKKAAIEINQVVDPKPHIDVVGSKKTYLEKALKIIGEKVVDPDIDDLSRDTIEVLESLDCSPYEPLNKGEAEDEQGDDTEDEGTEPEDSKTEDTEDDGKTTEATASDSEDDQGEDEGETPEGGKTSSESDNGVLTVTHREHNTRPPASNTTGKSAKELIGEFIAEGTHTQKEIVQKLVDLGYKKGTPQALLSMSKNPDYQLYDELAETGEDGNIKFANG